MGNSQLPFFEQWSEMLTPGGDAGRTEDEGDVRTASAWATDSNTRDAVSKAYAALSERLGGAPRYLVVHASVTHDLAEIATTLRALAPGVPVHGGTSCLGVMTEEGFHSDGGTGLGMFGVLDPDGAYGVGSAENEGDPAKAAADAARAAIERAGRAGEAPAMLWITGTPGHEERTLAALASVVGPNVPVAGGSAADNDVSGHWSQFTSEAVHRQGVVVSALYPSSNVVFHFHSGYDPTSTRARITRGSGRRIDELDGEPAAVVYNRWLGGALSDALAAGGNILPRTTLQPLGRVAGHVGDVAYHQLIHPDSITKEGALTLFADVTEGEELVLMRGSPESLVTRAGRVARSAVEQSGAPEKKPLGALVIYCAGCMLTIRERMDDVVKSIDEGLSGQPFLGAFTFGEQGCLMSGKNRHGNLMISVLAFMP
ncbi:MAG: FIST N-terminal domain-containing protein [Polyangiaceae bacterium]